MKHLEVAKFIVAFDLAKLGENSGLHLLSTLYFCSKGLEGKTSVWTKKYLVGSFNLFEK